MIRKRLIDFNTRRFPWTLDRLFPISIVIAIFCFEYSIFIRFTFARLLTHHASLGLLVGAEFHLIIVLMIVCYYKCINTHPGTVPLDIVLFDLYFFYMLNDNFSELHNIKERAKKLTVNKIMKNKSLEKDTIIRTLGLSQDEDLEEYSKVDFDIVHELQLISYCFKCNLVRFPRTHHCKVCKMCVIRMDHHCPWIGNCVGLFNHKYFILFLIYASINLLNVPVVSLIYYFSDKATYLDGLDKTELTSLQINCMTSFALFLAVSYLGGYQIRSAMRNQTTVENQIAELAINNPFNKGNAYHNLADIFGPYRSTWLLPVNPRHLALENEMLDISHHQNPSSYE